MFDEISDLFTLFVRDRDSFNITAYDGKGHQARYWINCHSPTDAENYTRIMATEYISLLNPVLISKSVLG